MENEVIKNLLNHRTIRSFKDKKLTKEQVNTLVASAQQGSTDQFGQQYSIINVSDPDKINQLADITTYQFIKEADQFFLFVVDQNRNKQILRHLDPKIDTSSLGSTDKFMAGVYDASIGIQNMLIAAESMGLGGAIMGSIANDTGKVIDMFNLPELTYPVFGLAIGYPNENPEVKPRLNQNNMYFDNEYQEVNFNQLDDYDNLMKSYYQNRSSNQKNTSFSEHLFNLQKNNHIRTNMLPNMKKQGFLNQ